MATSLFGLLQGGAQQAVRDAAIAENPRALQRAQGAISTGTLRAGANPVAVSRQYAQQTADMGARLAAQQKQALAQAKMEDAAGATQLLGVGLDALSTGLGYAFPGAQAAKPAVNALTQALMNRPLMQREARLKKEQALSQPAGGVPDPRGALAGAQPVQGSQQPLTASEAVPPPNPYGPSEAETLGMVDQAIATFPQDPTVAAATGMIDRGIAAASPNLLQDPIAQVDVPAPGSPAARPPAQPYTPLVATPERIAAYRQLQAESQGPLVATPERIAAYQQLQRDAAPPTSAPPMYASPTLSGTSPAELQQAQQREFNNRLAGAAQAERLSGTIQRNAGPPPVVTSQEQIARGREAQAPALMSYLASQQENPELGAINPDAYMVNTPDGPIAQSQYDYQQAQSAETARRQAASGYAPAELDAMRRAALRQEQERSLMDRGREALSAVGTALGSYFGF